MRDEASTTAELLELQLVELRYCRACSSRLTPQNHEVDGSWCDLCTSDRVPAPTVLFWDVESLPSVKAARAHRRAVLEATRDEREGRL